MPNLLDQNFGPFDVSVGQIGDWMSQNAFDPTANPQVNTKMGAAAFIVPVVQTLLQQFLNDRATDKQNAYNTPSAQMQRLAAAGINPYSAASFIAGNNTSAPRQAAQVRADNAIGNMMQLLSVQSMKEDLRGKKIQNDILANNLRYQDKFNSNRLESQTLGLLKSELQRLLLDGKVTRQTYDNILARVNAETHGLYFHRGENDNPIWELLTALGFTDIPDSLPIDAIPTIVSGLRNSLQGVYEFDTFETNKAMLEKRKEFLDKQFEMLEEQLRHAMTMNDKTERWFFVNQLMQTFSQLVGMATGITGIVRTGNLIQNNPYAQ